MMLDFMPGLAINGVFLAINLLHLFFLGNLFQQPDMTLADSWYEMEKFGFISPKIAIFVCIFGHFC